MGNDQFLSSSFAAGHLPFPVCYSDPFISDFPFPITPLPLFDPPQDHLLLLFFPNP
jgi:hypothetical protein